jgi:hypothetical protein
MSMGAPRPSRFPLVGREAEAVATAGGEQLMKRGSGCTFPSWI